MANQALIGAGMALQGAAYGGQAYQPLAPIPGYQMPMMHMNNNATILQPGQPPMFYRGNPMGGGTVIQPGQQPVFIYPY
jgi:hypothetical protein